MRIPCLYIAEELMPFIRAKMAERMYSMGMKQGDIARYLGTTQTMVSKYLAGNYRSPPPEVRKELTPIIEEVASFLALGGRKEDGIALLSQRLMELFRRGVLCRDYSKYAGIPEEACSRIMKFEEERPDVLHSLQLALDSVVDVIAPLIPEVRSNFVYAVGGAEDTGDVAAIPGRITAVKGRAFALPPEFGASKFMAGIVLEVMKFRPEIRSVINLRYGEDVENALELAGFKVARVRTGGLDERDAMAEIARPFREAQYDVVVDEGGKGVEPLVYVFGRNPMEVVDKVRKLLEVMG